jgi:hypothetical protein
MDNLITVTKKGDRRPSIASGCVSAPTRELARRQSGGLDVLLLWHPEADRVELSVRDSTSGAGFQIEVAPGDANEAFYHPYAYAARLESSHGVDRDEAAILDG